MGRTRRIWIGVALAAAAATGCESAGTCIGAAQIAAGIWDTAVIMKDGRTLVWGDGMPAPREWLDSNAVFTKLVLGYAGRCAIGTGQQIICAGNSEWQAPSALDLAVAQLADPRDDPEHDASIPFSGSFPPRCRIDLDGRTLCRWTSKPDFVVVDEKASLVSAGADHVCVAGGGRGVRCTGRSLIPGDLSEAVWALPFDAIGTDIAALASNGQSQCALTTAGALWCWGRNRYGETGTPRENEVDPVNVNPVLGGAAVTTVSMGESHTCATTDDGDLWCWGQNRYGVLGNRDFDIVNYPRHPPARVAGFERGVVAVAAGMGHTCAIDRDSAVWCWGRNDTGQVGNGTAQPTGGGLLGAMGFPGIFLQPTAVASCQ